MLLVRKIVVSHPLLDLSEQDVLGLRVAEQVVQFDGQFGPFDDRIVLRVVFLHAVERDCVIDVLDSLLVKHVMHSLEVVPELELAEHVGTSRDRGRSRVSPCSTALSLPFWRALILLLFRL